MSYHTDDPSFHLNIGTVKCERATQQNHVAVSMLGSIMNFKSILILYQLTEREDRSTNISTVTSVKQELSLEILIIFGENSMYYPL